MLRINFKNFLIQYDKKLEKIGRREKNRTRGRNQEQIKMEKKTKNRLI